MSTAYDIAPDDPTAPDCAGMLLDYVVELQTRIEGRPPTEEEVAAFRAQNSAHGITPPDGIFLAARDAAGTALGCVGVRWTDEVTGEVKRMYVAPAGRGLGLGRALLLAAHDAIRASGRSRARLDTRGELVEAIGLYGSAGYEQIPRYNDNPYAQSFWEARLD